MGDWHNPDWADTLRWHLDKSCLTAGSQADSHTHTSTHRHTRTRTYIQLVLWVCVKGRYCEVLAQDGQEVWMNSTHAHTVWLVPSLLTCLPLHVPWLYSVHRFYMHPNLFVHVLWYWIIHFYNHLLCKLGDLTNCSTSSSSGFTTQYQLCLLHRAARIPGCLYFVHFDIHLFVYTLSMTPRPATSNESIITLPSWQTANSPDFFDLRAFFFTLAILLRMLSFSPPLLFKIIHDWVSWKEQALIKSVHYSCI